jgi:hypothetical protein
MSRFAKDSYVENRLLPIHSNANNFQYRVVLSSSTRNKIETAGYICRDLRLFIILIHPRARLVDQSVGREALNISDAMLAYKLLDFTERSNT